MRPSFYPKSAADFFQACASEAQGFACFSLCKVEILREGFQANVGLLPLLILLFFSKPATLGIGPLARFTLHPQCSHKKVKKEAQGTRGKRPLNSALRFYFNKKELSVVLRIMNHKL
jgi:hypothetical protein